MPVIKRVHGQNEGCTERKTSKDMVSSKC